MITKRSRLAYAETLRTLKETMLEGGNTIFASIDQSAAAQSAGMTLRPTELIIFGYPKGGTPFMHSFPFVALDLPLKLVVWEESENVSVAYVTMKEIAERYNVAGMDARVEEIDAALDSLTNAVI